MTGQTINAYLVGWRQSVYCLHLMLQRRIEMFKMDYSESTTVQLQAHKR